MIRDLADRLHDADRSAFLSVARAKQPRAVDAVVPRLTSLADNGLLWVLYAIALALTGTRGRRAAVRGLMSLNVASGIANGPLKWTFRRRRPPLVDVPVVRQLTRQPRTTSFPSGHSASAAAFATGALLESPVRAIPAVAAAAGVAYGRVHTGVHYPSDVAAGIAVGVASAVVVRRVWPVRPDAPAAARAALHEAPALPDGDGLVLVINAAAESTSAVADALVKTVEERLPRAEVVRCEKPDQLPDVFADAAARARVLGVAGGDGTTSTAAGAAADHGVPLLVFPAGTLNHFAQELGVDSVDDAIDALQEGSAVEVTVSEAGDAPFLNTFSLGLYPELVARREQRERVLGKWPALAVALIEVLGRANRTNLEIDGVRRTVWLVFGGNGRYHPAGFAPSWRERLDEDVVDIRVVDALRPWSRTRLVAAVLTGRLGRCRVYEERVASEVSIRFLDPEPALAHDGESSPAPEQIVLRPRARLVVYRP